MTDQAAISCIGLKKHYSDVRAVDGIDLEVLRGECFGLLGPNGAGKTTTIEILEGLNTPDAGQVRILGRAWEDDEREIRERIGVSLQETQFSEKVSVYETLRLFSSFYRRGRDPEQLLRDLSLEEKRNARVGKLSGGQKQRLGVACALVGEPEILFLDEPTTGLDPQSRLQLWDIVAGYRARGGTVLLTTHYMEEAERLCDRIAIIDHGKRIALGTPKELIARLEAPHIIDLTTLPALEEQDFASITGFHGATRRAEAWQLRVDSLAASVPELIGIVDAKGVKLDTLSTHAATLEDLFVALTGRELRDV